MKILVSGATGFIGKNLVAYFTKEIKEVTFCFLVRKKTGAANELLLEELLAGKPDIADVDAVVHLAGLAHDTRNTLDDSAYYKVNFEMTRLMYDWFLNSSAKKFIYVSSAKAVADTVNGELKEDVSPSPVTPYGKSKLKAEEYIKQLSLGVEDKAYYILRPCMVHGPGNKGNLNLLYKFIIKGLPYPLGAYNNTRSFLSVDNFCFVCCQLLTRDIAGGVYNLADDKSLSTKELYSIIAKAAGNKPKVWNLPKPLINTIAKAGDAVKLPVNTERIEKLTENYVVSNEKIKQALGIKNLPVSAEDGITKTIQSFKEDK